MFLLRWGEGCGDACVSTGDLKTDTPGDLKTDTPGDLKTDTPEDLKPSTEHLKTPPIPDRTERDPYGYLVLTKTTMKST
jgi:hypothetical protein